MNKTNQEKRQAIEPRHPDLSIEKQCQLLNIPRSSYYYQPVVAEDEFYLMNRIDEIYTDHPYYGVRRIKVELRRRFGRVVNRKKIYRLMKIMGIAAVFPKRNLSKPHPDHPIYPYLLRDLEIVRPNQVWQIDITYIRLKEGWIYFVAVIDVYSRYILAWETAISLEIAFVLTVIKRAYEQATEPAEIVNSDQGSHFTSPQYIVIVKGNGSLVSMDGKGRAIDNIYIERFFWSLKHERIYLKEYTNAREAKIDIGSYIHFYDTDRPHSSLGNKTPAEAYFKKQKPIKNSKKRLLSPPRFLS